MKKLKKIFMIMLCVVLITPCMNVSAATQRQRAISAYKKWLSATYVRVLQKGTVYYDDWAYKRCTYSKTKASAVKFALAYIDGDSIPELVVYTKKGHVELFGILTYKNGKVRRVYSSTGSSKILGYYKKTGCFLERAFSEGTPYYDNYYKMSGAKSTKKYSKFSYSIYSTEAEYYISGKSATKKAFTSGVQNLTKKKSMTKLKFYKNTKANRNKKIK